MYNDRFSELLKIVLILFNQICLIDGKSAIRVISLYYRPPYTLVPLMQYLATSLHSIEAPASFGYIVK